MKRSSLPLLSVVALTLLAFTVSGLRAQGDVEYAENQVIVKMKPGTVLGEREAVLADLGAVVLRQFSLIGAELWSVPGLSTEQAIDRFSGDPRIEYIEPNYVVYAADLFPDDPSFFQLWGLHNTGQTGGTPDADIDAPEAWQIQTGNDVLIGVIDTGVDWTHEDLAANIWTNPGEIPDNNTDDDGNGYIDDVRGWDFVNNDNNPMDDHGHGTHVSGTIAAVGDNGIGVVGVDWSARIMPLKFLDSEGRGYTGNAVLAVEYATMMGARLTNNSWGGGAASTALRDAIAASGAAGMLFVAASGNSGVDTDSYPHYPSSYDLPNIISVAWTDHNDALASHSNYGATSVDLGAPGGSIYSTLPGNTYGYFSGTSMATPHVSGVAGLLWADDPGLSNAEVKNFVLSSVDTIPDLVGRTVSGGRLNAFGALHALIDTIPPAEVTDLAAGGATSNSLTLTWTATGDDGYNWTADAYDVRYSLAPIDGSNFDTATEAAGEPEPGPPGSAEEFTVGGLTFGQTYYFALKVIDGRGNASDVSNSPSGTTLGPPTVSVSPASLEESLLTGGASSQVLTVANVGEGTLDFLFSVNPWMTVDPSSGTVWTGDDTPIMVTFDATGLSGGDHLDTLFVTSNDPDDPDHGVPVVLHVTAAPDIAVSDTLLNFGPTWIGETVTDTIVVSNDGSDDLVVDGVAIDNPEFSTDPAGFVLAAGEHRALPVSFAPESEGLRQGTLTIISNDPFEPSKDVPLQGVGGTAPVITVSANAFSANLATGETSTQYLEIGNIGGSDLIFTIIEGTGGAAARITSPVARRTSRDGIEQTSPAASLRGTGPTVSGPKAGVKDLRSLADLMGIPSTLPHSDMSAVGSTFGKYRGLDAAAGEPVDIALVHSNVNLTAFLPALSAYPDIGTVDVIDGQAIVPTLGTLLQYDCVVLTINSVLADPIGMGDVLADYVDAGGAVILTEGAFTNHPPFDFSIYGRFMDEGYSPFERGPLVS
ncbi:MAG: S8 family serine peptidase, partial [bacterium]